MAATEVEEETLTEEVTTTQEVEVVLPTAEEEEGEVSVEEVTACLASVLA
jgi:hypothetical protein